MNKSMTGERLVNALRPLRTYESPSFTARETNSPQLPPVSGSVRPPPIILCRLTDGFKELTCLGAENISTFNHRTEAEEVHIDR